MSEAEKYFRKVIEGRVTEIHTTMPCRIESFNEVTFTAKIVPLFKVKFKDQQAIDRPPIENVPVLRQKRKSGDIITIETPYYEPGDIVLVIFMERAMDMVQGNSTVDPKYSRKHALEDAVIIGYLGG